MVKLETHELPARPSSDGFGMAIKMLFISLVSLQVILLYDLSGYLLVASLLPILVPLIWHIVVWTLWEMDRCNYEFVEKHGYRVPLGFHLTTTYDVRVYRDYYDMEERELVRFRDRDEEILFLLETGQTDMGNA